MKRVKTWVGTCSELLLVIKIRLVRSVFSRYLFFRPSFPSSTRGGVLLLPYWRVRIDETSTKLTRFPRRGVDVQEFNSAGNICWKFVARVDGNSFHR